MQIKEVTFIEEMPNQVSFVSHIVEKDIVENVYG